MMAGGDPPPTRASRRSSPAWRRRRSDAVRTYIGPDGAGHYVKMVHNGIEYADMQLIAEAYDMLKSVHGLSAGAIGDNVRGLEAGRLEILSDRDHGDGAGKRDADGAPLVDRSSTRPSRRAPGAGRRSRRSTSARR